MPGGQENSGPRVPPRPSSPTRSAFVTGVATCGHGANSQVESSDRSVVRVSNRESQIQRGQIVENRFSMCSFSDSMSRSLCFALLVLIAGATAAHNSTIEIKMSQTSDLSQVSEDSILICILPNLYSTIFILPNLQPDRENLPIVFGVK